MANRVFIATSLDGYIADVQGKLDWLDEIPNPQKNDCGYAAFMQGIDAIVMGRKTFDSVCGFDCPWPYAKPVFVLSHSLTAIPDKYSQHASLLKGELKEMISTLKQQGYHQLYIDGGVTIQNFLKADLIDEMIITTLPILLGGGVPLFGELNEPIRFEHVKTEVMLDAMVQSHYRNKHCRRV